MRSSCLLLISYQDCHMFLSAKPVLPVGAQDYGFPSTHSINAVSNAAFVLLQAPPPSPRLLPARAAPHSMRGCTIIVRQGSSLSFAAPPPPPPRSGACRQRGVGSRHAQASAASTWRLALAGSSRLCRGACTTAHTSPATAATACSLARPWRWRGRRDCTPSRHRKTFQGFSGKF